MRIMLVAMMLGIVALFCAIQPATAADRYRLNNGQVATVDEHGVCHEVTNGSGNDVLIPTRTADEWTRFRTYKPAGVSLASCVTYSYSGWSAYGACSQSCGGGTQSRSRTCRRSTDNASVACSNCGGVCSQSRSCNTGACSTGRWSFNDIAEYDSASVPYCGDVDGESCDPLGSRIDCHLGSGTGYAVAGYVCTDNYTAPPYPWF